METWPAKDPQAKKDYTYRIALDPGDSITAGAPNPAGPWNFEKLSGDAVIDTPAPAIEAAPSTDENGVYGQDVVVWLSGGTDGETNVFRVSWETAAGREDDDAVLLPIVPNEPAELVLTGYAKPAPAHLIARYPAFAAVATDTIRTWLVDAERFVDQSWAEGDYAAALMALAAHNMALLGLGAAASGAGALPAGVTRFKSASMDVTISEAAAGAQAKGGYGSTLYGQAFATLQRRNFGGPRLIAAGTLPACGAYW